MTTERFREVHHLELRLSYADCDPARILYFAAWFPWMERVHTEWLYLNDLRQDTLDERYGFRTITRAAECEYLAPASLFQRVRIGLGVAHLGRTSFRWDLRMTRLDDGGLVARGSMTLVTIGTGGSPVPVPEPLRSLVAQALPR
ncbi:acyl-CoA thioesterase [Lentzea sp. E54]|uniref:acyl-CoA thioesterase n=1 Tax=Lentzea xerophila TaxID=3435883 RepID=UPI003DA5A1C9